MGMQVTLLAYRGGGSDKVYAACLDGADVRARYGRRGATLNPVDKHYASAAEAEREYRKKVKEKKDKGYMEVADGDPAHGLQASALFGPAAGAATTRGAGTPAAGTPAMDPERARLAGPALPQAGPGEVARAMASPLWGLTEKVDGRYVAVEVRGGTLSASNRRGLPLPAPPPGAAGLAALGDLLAAGEWLDGDFGGSFAAFDLLERGGKDLRARPYAERAAALADAARGAGIAHTAGPSLARAYRLGKQRGILHILTPEADTGRKAALSAWLQGAGAEGVILRELGAPHGRGAWKQKFLDDIDVAITGIAPGAGGGSAKMSLYPPGGGDPVPAGHVRSGLSEADMGRLASMLARGEIPVLRVRYLGARTRGTALVEPRTSMADLRDPGEKVAAECTTDQLRLAGGGGA